MEKLESAELLTTKPSAGLSAEDEAKNESFMASLTNRIIDNLQLTVKNVHLRYEDDVSVPGHPFSIGITLGGFTAVSTDGQWQPTFIHNSTEGIHKIAKLDSLSVYFDSESKSLAGHQPEEAIKEFNALIANADKNAKPVSHQYILAPVSGEGRLIMNHHVNATTPKTDAELLFKELAFTIDEDQYRDALSLVDLMHFYTRKHQYRKYKPAPKLIEDNKYKALWKFAQDSILHEVQDKHRRWTWDYFKERRDERRLYVYTFKLNARGEITPDDKSKLDELEKKLSYQDIRFYRSIARSELRKERANARQTAEQKKLQQGPTGKGTSGSSASSGWLGWVWGSKKTEAHAEDDQPQDLLSDEQRKELYDAIDWDEKDAVTSGIDVPRDALKLRLKAKLDAGSFALRRDPHGRNFDMLKVTFDRFSADVLQRPDNLEAEMSLGGMGVFDGTLENSLHKQIVKVKQADDDSSNGGYLVAPEDRGSNAARDAHSSSGDQLSKLSEKAGVAQTEEDPFFYVKFEQNPLDERADTGLTVKMRYMEIVYHKGYVEDIVRFFKPPASQLESVNALVDAASSTLEGIRKETRAGLEFALAQHKTVDLRVAMNAYAPFSYLKKYDPN
jgi:vacuolar protein sorting-associated protein 13A/C